MRRIRERLTLPLPPSPPPAGPAPAAPPPPPPPPTPPAAPAVVNVNPLELPDTMNPAVFLKRLQTLRASKEETMKELTRLEDDPSLDVKTRLTRVFRALYNTVVNVKGT